MRTLSRLLGSAAVALIIGLSCPPVVGAQAVPLPDSYTISARADGFLMEYFLPQTPLVGTGGGLVDVSSASAQALVNSLGRSTAYASAPYPGEILVGLPGLANGLGAGDLPPVPDYPLYVNADYPAEPARRAELGPYVLAAESGEIASSGSMTVGVSSTDDLKIGAVNATADSWIDESSGLLVAEAWSASDPISIGGLLSIGKIETHARMEAMPGEAPEVVASIDLGTISIAGVKVGLTQDGFEVAGPLPGVSAAVLTDLLASADITFEVVPAVKTDTTYVSEGLRIEYGAEVPAVGTVRVSFLLGRVSVSISSAVSAALPSGELGPPVEAALTPTPDAVVFDEPSIPSPVLPVPAITPEPAPTGTTPSMATPVSAGFERSPIDLRAGRFYLAIVAVAFVTLAASRVLGVFGIQIWPRDVAVPASAVRLQLPSR